MMRFGGLLRHHPTMQEVTPMASTHQTALQSKHAVLDRRLAEEAARPMPDTLVIADLKKQKLKLKEEFSQP